MSKVITFSRVFPSYHPKAGQPTYFVEKIWNTFRSKWDFSLPDEFVPFVREYVKLKLVGEPLFFSGVKHHTIRAGHRFKVGDKFSPRVWSGKPYRSPQITIGPDIEIKMIQDIEVDGDGCIWIISDTDNEDSSVLETLALNDGLTLPDLQAWFNKPMTGQIICWNENVNY